MTMKTARLIFLTLLALAGVASLPASETLLVRSAQSGPWSAIARWAGDRVPPAGASVQIRAGHTVIYDLDSAQPVRAVFIAGTLSFARDRNPRLAVGNIEPQPPILALVKSGWQPASASPAAR